MASIQLGADYCHDAILIGELFGRVTAMYGYRNLAAIRTELDRETAQRASATLRSIVAARSPGRAPRLRRMARSNDDQAGAGAGRFFGKGLNIMAIRKAPMPIPQAPI